MTWFEGDYSEVFTVDVPLERAVAHFGDLEAIMRCYPDLERFEVVDDRTRDIVLVEERAVGVSFQGRYRCRWEVGDDVITWRSIGGGNTETGGRCQMVALDDGRTRVDYHYFMKCDIDVNRLVGKAVAPFVRRDITRGGRSYLEAMRALLRGG